MNPEHVYTPIPVQLINSTVFYVVITDWDANFLSVNPLMQETFFTEKELPVNTSFFDALFPDDRAHLQKAIYACNQQPDKPISVAVRLNKQLRNQSDHWIQWELSVFKQEGVPTEGIVFIGHNISSFETQSKRLYELADNGEPLDSKKFRSLVNHIPGVIYRCLGDEYLSLQFFSDEIEKLTGYPVAYFIENRKEGYLKIVHDEDRLLLKNTIAGALAERGKFELEYRIIHRNGQLKWVFESGQGVYEAADQMSYMDGCIFDITNRKNMELALLKSEDEVKRLALVAYNTTNSVMITDVDEKITWINEGYTRISGYTIDEIRGKKIGYSIDGSEVDPMMRQKIRQALDHQQPFKDEFISYTKNGNTIWLEVDCQPLFDEQGRHLGFMAIESDITQRKETLKQQDELLQRLTLATDSAGVGIYEIDLITHQVVWDERMYELYGYRAGTKMNLYKIFFTALHPDDKEMMTNILSDLMNQKKEVDGAVYRIILPDGKTRYIESHAIIRKAENGVVQSLIGTNRDVTEEILVQQKIKSQNLVLREIAFSQSHEVRRPLANILALIEVLKGSGEINDLEIFDHLQESVHELDQQIRNIVNKTNNINDEVFR